MSVSGSIPADHGDAAATVTPDSRAPGGTESKKRGSYPSFGYLRGLDGVRGVALIMVLLIHGGNPWMHGGFFAVDVFFVLSGFLITSLLLQEYDRATRISLKDFWIRRALRLFPAFIVLLVVITAYVLLFVDGPQRSLELEALLSGATYTSNWVMALTNNRDLQPVLLGPMWSLSIEMQFYILWPLIVIGVLFLIRRIRGEVPTPVAAARALLVTAAVLAVVVAANRTIMTAAGANWWRAYGGTDTHTDGLLVGCVLACLVALGALRRWPSWLGWAGLAVLVVIVANGWLMLPWTALWGFAAVALASAALIGSVAARQWISKPLSWGPFVFLGRISYGTYLWHFPVYLVFLLDPPTLVLPWWKVAAAMAIALSLGTASFYLVERPALRLKRRFERTRAGLETAEAQTTPAHPHLPHSTGS